MPWPQNPQTQIRAVATIVTCYLETSSAWVQTNDSWKCSRFLLWIRKQKQQCTACSV